MKNIVNLIATRYDELTNSHKIIADFILENSSTIIYDTLTELANKIGVSTTSIIRFSKDLGLSGYSELLECIRKFAALDEPYNASKTLRQMEENEDISDFFTLTIQKDIENLTKTISSNTRTDLEKAVELIANARKVYITGFNDSFTLAYYMDLRLAQVREGVSLLMPVGGMYPHQLASANEEDLIIAYWFPRYSLHTFNMIKRVRDLGGKAIIVTSTNVEKVKDFGDVILPTHIHGAGIKESLIAPLSLSSYLVSAVALEDMEKSKVLIDKSEAILQTGYYFDNKK